MPRSPGQRSAYKRHMSREARLARNVAIANQFKPESKDDLRAQAAQACASHAIKRIEPAPQPDSQPRQQLGGRTFFKGKRTRES